MQPGTTARDFGFRSEHALLLQAVKKLLAGRSGPGQARTIVGSELGYDPSLARQMSEHGWIGLAVPERLGGAGLDALALALVAEQCGRALVSGPILGSQLAAAALASADQEQSALLSELLRGERWGVVAFDEGVGSWEMDARVSQARRVLDGYALTGARAHVPWGQAAGLVLCPFAVTGELALFAVDCSHDNIMVDPEVGVDPTRRCARVIFGGVNVGLESRLSRGDQLAWQRLHVLGWIQTAAELVGVAEAVLAMTCEYAGLRQQFGRPIGSFQAISHPLVDAMIAVEQARSLTYAAAAAAAGEHALDNPETLARMAKAAACDAATLTCDRAVRTHGGYGFTWDCDVHFYFKRALALSAALGDSRHHRRHLAQSLASTLAPPS